MYYIEKNDKPRLFEQLFKIIKIEDNKIILPINKDDLNEKKSIKLANKTHRILQKTQSNKIVLSKELQKNEIYANVLHSYGYNIVDGRWLFEGISEKILNYITELKNIKKEETSISILVNNLTDYTLESIKILAKEYKTLNIVTNHIEKFKKIEKIIYQEYGLMITVTNNKKRSLNKSKVILNIDFPNEILNKYNIYDEAIIVNINGNIKINKKRFCGLVINDYEIKVKSIKENRKYYIKELYEAGFYKNIPFKELQDKIKKEKLEIEAVLGLNGKIL